MRLLDVNGSPMPVLKQRKGGQQMIWKLWKSWMNLLERRRSMAWMLRRKDDKWLDDIGLTRNELEKLLDE